MFARFSLLYVVNIKEIIANGEYTETDEWNALQELYKVDIDGFAQLELDSSFLENALKEDSGYGDPEKDDYDDNDEDPDEENEEDDDEDW